MAYPDGREGIVKMNNLFLEGNHQYSINFDDLWITAKEKQKQTPTTTHI